MVGSRAVRFVMPQPFVHVLPRMLAYVCIGFVGDGDLPTATSFSFRSTHVRPVRCVPTHWDAVSSMARGRAPMALRQCDSHTQPSRESVVRWNYTLY